MKRKPNCVLCGHRRVKKDYLQQGNCELDKKPENCESFVSAKEYEKYKMMMEGRKNDNSRM